jgi:hypothetical protein
MDQPSWSLEPLTTVVPGVKALYDMGQTCRLDEKLPDQEQRAMLRAFFLRSAELAYIAGV